VLFPDFTDTFAFLLSMLTILFFTFYSEFVKKVELYKTQREQKLLDVKMDAAKHVQSLVRGVLGRIKFRKNLPALKRAQKARSICCECEAVIAVRRCRQCKDKYCASCYDRIHSKGEYVRCIFLHLSYLI
jgi:hypothetical protein